MGVDTRGWRVGAGAVVLLGGCGLWDVHLGEEPWTPSPEQVAAWTDLVAFTRFEMAEHQIPGVQLAVVVDGHVAFSGGLGVTNVGLAAEDPDAAVHATTLFAVGGLSTTVTAAGALSLRDDGVLDLYAPLTDTVGWLELAEAGAASQLDVHQLLTHTSGLPDYYEESCGDAYESWWEEHGPEYPLWAPPGAVWNYSNLSYSLAGLAMVEAAGQPFDALIQERVLDPAGMADATYDAGEVLAGQYAVGHLLREDMVTPAVGPGAHQCAASWPSGQLWSSAADLGRLARALLHGGGAIASQGTADMMSAQEPTGWGHDNHCGYGFFLEPYRGLDVAWHDGYLHGYVSSLLMVPEQDFAVVALVNYDGYNPNLLTVEALELFLQPTGELEEYPIDPEAWGAWTGRYQDLLELGQVNVYLAKDGLWARFPGLGSSTPLEPQGGRVFHADILGITIPVTFWPDDEGRGEYLVTRLGVARRLEE